MVYRGNLGGGSGWVTRYSLRGYPYRTWSPPMPRIDDELLESIVYLYPSEADAEDGKKLGGTGFVVGVPGKNLQGIAPLLCVVTNKHLIDNGSTVVRVNTRDGRMDILATDERDWRLHPAGDDIAVCPIELDHFRHKANYISLLTFPSRKDIEHFKIGIGDDVYFAGRFVNREGKQRNIPTLRFGTIAQMPGDAIELENGYKQESFLIEARSIAGFSGSPVFVWIPAVTPLPPMSDVVRQNVMRLPNIRPERQNLTLPMGPWLLGIDYCHIQSREPVYSARTDDPVPDLYIKSNTGLMGVVPFWKIYDVVFSKEMHDLATERESEMAKKFSDSGVSLDRAAEKPKAVPTNDSNPAHKEDFTALLGEAARKQKQDD